MKKLLIFIIALLLLTTSVSANNLAKYNHRIILHYNFSECSSTAVNDTLGKYNITLNNMESEDCGTNPTWGDYIKFDGTNEYGEINGLTQWTLTRGEDSTKRRYHFCSIWFNQTAGATNDLMIGFGAIDEQGTDPKHRMIQLDTRAPKDQSFYTVVSDGGGATQVWITGQTAKQGTPQHQVYYMERGEGVWTFGADKAGPSATDNWGFNRFLDGAENLYLGAENARGSAANFFDGQIYQITCYEFYPVDEEIPTSGQSMVDTNGIIEALYGNETIRDPFTTNKFNTSSNLHKIRFDGSTCDEHVCDGKSAGTFSGLILAPNSSVNFMTNYDGEVLDFTGSYTFSSSHAGRNDASRPRFSIGPDGRREINLTDDDQAPVSNEAFNFNSRDITAISKGLWKKDDGGVNRHYLYYLGNGSSYSNQREGMFIRHDELSGGKFNMRSGLGDTTGYNDDWVDNLLGNNTRYVVGYRFDCNGGASSTGTIYYHNDTSATAQATDVIGSRCNTWGGSTRLNWSLLSNGGGGAWFEGSMQWTGIFDKFLSGQEYRECSLGTYGCFFEEETHINISYPMTDVKGAVNVDFTGETDTGSQICYTVQGDAFGERCAAQDGISLSSAVNPINVTWTLKSTNHSQTPVLKTGIVEGLDSSGVPLTYNYTENLIACYDTDDVRDHFGNYDGQLVGGAKASTKGKLHGGWHFPNPAIDNVRFQSNTSVPSTTWKNFTLNAWYKTNGTNDSIIFDFQGARGYMNKLLGTKLATTSWSSDCSLFFGSTAIDANEWYMLTYARNATHCVVYLDDKFDFDEVTPAGSRTVGDQIYVGATGNHLSQADGTISTVKIWKEFFNESKVAELYNTSFGVDCQAIENSGKGGGTPPVDSCTYSGSGDHTYQCSDNCVISTKTNFGGNDFLITGSGTFLGFDNIVNYGNGRIDSSCKVWA